MAAKEGIDRAHSHRASTGGGSEFFICFTARLSSTSRAHSSKSLMSPGRTAPSLSASLSRRLRSGSVKGAQSPMFPGGGGGSRRRAFEAAEPSSPKVTCIGQVRVKAKKKNVVSVGVGTPVARTRSQREASFRREPEERECLPNRSQSWVYQLPLSICEALRAIGSEVNCFVPCKGGRSPCFSSSTSPSKVKRRSRSTSSCGAVFARWLMAIDEEGEEGERGEVVDLVVEGREKGEVGFLVREMEKEVEIIGLDQLSSGEVDRKAEVVVVEEEGRVSVCIPPRNALLLMRCRSDPARVAALADRFWGSPAAAKDPVLHDREKDGNAAHDHKEEEEEGHVPDLDVEFEAEAEKEETEESVILPSAHEEKEVAIQEEEATSILSEENVGVAESNTCVEPEAAAATGEGDEYEEIEKGRRSRSCSSSSKPGGRRRSCSSRDKERRRHSFSSEQEARRKSFSIEKDGRRASFSDGRRRRSFSLEKDDLAAKPTIAVVAEEHENKYLVRNQAAETGVEGSKPILVAEETQIRVDGGERKMVEARAKDGDQLPDCLLQMMYEPKLSMEVSKETWVCSDDFLRWRPHRPAAKPVVGDSDNTVGDSEGCGGHNGEVALEAEEEAEAEAEAELPDQPPTPPPLPPLVLQPSTPLPTVIVATERKVISSSVVVATAAAYGVPLVLTRCNSEPVRSSARLAPDVGFWKNRHQPIGAAEVGF